VVIADERRDGERKAAWELRAKRFENAAVEGALRLGGVEIQL